MTVRLQIKGERQSGKTRALISHLDTFLSSNNQATAAIICANHQDKVNLVNRLLEVSTPDVVKRTVFYNIKSGIRGRSRKIDGLYIDNLSNFSEIDIEAAKELAQTSQFFVTTENIENA